MTINIQDHINKKKSDKNKKIYTTIANLFVGIAIGEMLKILLDFVVTATEKLPATERSKVAMVFYSNIIHDKEKETDNGSTIIQ